MKILFLTTSYPRFGKNQREFAMNIHNIAKEISRKGNEVTVVAPNDNNTLGYKKVNNVVIDRFSYWFTKQSQRVAYGDGIPDNLKNSLLAKIQFPFFLFFFFLKSVNTARGKDIIHAHWLLSGLVGIFVSRFLDIPIYITFRGSGIRNSPKAISKFVVYHSDAINVDSQNYKDMVDELCVNYNHSPVKLKYINEDVFNKNINGDKIIKEFNLQGKRVITHVGRLVSTKEVDVLIKSMSYIQKARPKLKYKLLIVGNGPLKPELEILAESLGLRENIIFLGNRSDVSEIYSAADINISCQIDSICFSNAILEGMAVGTPCLIPRTRYSELYWRSEFDSILYKKRDPKSLSYSIIKILEDDSLYNKVKQNAVKWHIQNNFTKEMVVKQTIEFYKNIRK